MPEQRGINPWTGQPYPYKTMGDYLGDIPSRINAALEGLGRYQHTEPGTGGEPGARTSSRRPGLDIAEGIGEYLGDEVNRMREHYGGQNAERYGALGALLHPFADAAQVIGSGMEGIIQGPPLGETVRGGLEALPYGREALRFLTGSEGEQWVFGEPEQTQPGGIGPEGVPEYLARPEEPGEYQPQVPQETGAGPQPGLGGGIGSAGVSYRGGVSEKPAAYLAPGGGGGGGGGLFQLHPEQQALLDQYQQLGQPEPVPRPPEGEQLMRVLAGLAGGAAQWTPGPGGVARSIAAAGAGGLGAGLGYQEELRQAQHADQQAQREYNMNRILLQGQMQDQAAKLNLMQEEILSREAMAKLRANAQYARAWAKASEIKAVSTPYGTWFYNNQGGREFVDASNSPGFIMTQAKNMAAAGVGAGGQTEFIVNQMLTAQDMPEALKTPYSVASLMLHFQIAPELTNRLSAELEDSDARYQTARLAEIQGKAGAAERADTILSHALMSYLMQHPDEMDMYARQIGDPGSFGHTPFQRGLSEFMDLKSILGRGVE